MRKIKKTITVALVLVSGHLAAFPDTNGWIFGVVEQAHAHTNLAPYFSDYSISEMYAQRDYLKASSVGHLMTDVYDHWTNIQINAETSVMYESFLRNYNKKIFNLMYANNSNMENEIFVDDKMLKTVNDIVKYHIDKTNNSDFKRFLVDVGNAANMLHGKTVKESRDSLFPNAGTCTPAQVSAGFC